MTADGIVIMVRVTPRGGRDSVELVEQLADGRSVLKVRVRAAASEGAANAALFAVGMLAASDAGLAKKLSEYRDKMREQVAAMQLPDVL